MATIRALRYIVFIPGQEEQASYNCSLGNREAKSWAMQNARTYGGAVQCQLNDTSIEWIADYRRSYRPEPAAESV